MNRKRAILSERGIYLGVVLLFALLVGSYFVYQLQQVVLTFLLTLLFAVIVSGPVNYLARRGLSRGWGTMLVIGVTVLAAPPSSSPTARWVG